MEINCRFLLKIRITSSSSPSPIVHDITIDSLAKTSRYTVWNEFFESETLKNSLSSSGWPY